MKTCNTCKTIKPKTSFSKHKRMHDGLQPKCKECEKKQNARFRQVKKEEQERTNKLYRINKLKELDGCYSTKRAKVDMLFKTKRKIQNRLNQALLKRYSNKSFIYEVLQCTWEDFIKHMESKFQDGMSWDNRPEWDIDHIIPFAFAKSIKDLFILNHYSNLQPLFKHDNRAKFTSLPQNIEKKFLELTELYDDFQKNLKIKKKKY